MEKSLFVPHLMHTTTLHSTAARETKIEKDAVQLHSARNETKLTAAAAQCATKTRYSRAKSGRESESVRATTQHTMRAGGVLMHTLSHRSCNALL